MVIVVVFIYWPRDAERPRINGEQIRVDFSYATEPLTRTRTFNLCAPPYLEEKPDAQSYRYPECIQPDAALPSGIGTPTATEAPRSTASPGPAEPPSIAVRPTIASVGLVGDLGRVDETTGKCTGGQVFPAGQLAMTATNFDTQGITLTVVANPIDPDVVAPGTYCSNVLITRSPPDSKVIEVIMAIDVGNRFSGWVLLKVFTSLMIGSALGATVKWVADNVKPGKPIPSGNPLATPSDVNFIAAHPGFVLGVATTIVVAGSGIASQFIPDSTFNDHFLDYFALGFWAFTGQLAGQTLLDAAGGVRSSKSTSTEVPDPAAAEPAIPAAPEPAVPAAAEPAIPAAAEPAIPAAPEPALPGAPPDRL